MALSGEGNAEYGFRYYSLGIVVRDKEEGSDWIDVTPIEDFPMELGRLSDGDRVKEATMADTADVKKTSKIQGGTVVRAKWTPISNPNRDNAPDVYRTETVMLYKYADTQDYYWSTIFREPKLRGRERVRISLSNKDAGGDSFNSDSSYWVEFDTRHKHVKIHTSDNDGEPTSYDITIDTKQGTVNLEDRLGNRFFLESVPGHLEVTTENSMTFNTKRFTLNASESVEVNTPKHTLNADETSEVNAPEHTLNSDKSTINGETHTVNNQLNATNGFNLSGGSGGATGKLTGNLEVDGSIHATGTIMDEGGNSNHHGH